MKKYKAVLTEVESGVIGHLPMIDDFSGLWSRQSAGVYLYTSEGSFPDIMKVWNPAYQNHNYGGMYTDYNGIQRTLGVVDVNTLMLRVTENGEPADGFLAGFPIEFEVYP